MGSKKKHFMYAINQKHISCMQYVFAFPCVFMVVLEGFMQQDFLRENFGCFYHDLHGFNGDFLWDKSRNVFLSVYL